MKKKTDMERYLEEQKHFFEEEELKLQERMAKQTERELSELLAKESEAYKRLVRDTKTLLIDKRNIDRKIAGELAETLILKLLRENIAKKRQENQE